ncbi:MAG: hypothetical protein WBQ25_13060 [Nitrososphaeraceae archaeon]
MQGKAVYRVEESVKLNLPLIGYPYKLIESKLNDQFYASQPLIIISPLL